MAAAAIPAGMTGGRMIGGGAQMMANAAAGPMGAAVNGAQNLWSRLHTDLGGGTGSNGSGSGGGRSGNTGGRGSAATAAVLHQFRSAGASGSQQNTGGGHAAAGSGQTQSPPNSGGTTQADLSFVKDANARARLERFGGLGKEP
jgi:hypothetical protein